MSEALDRLLERRLARRRGGRAASLLAAMVLHGGAVALAWLGPQLMREKPRPIEYVPVVLVPPPARGIPEARPAPPAPEPRREPEPPPPQPKPDPLPPQPKPDPLPAAEPAREAPKPEPKPAAPARRPAPDTAPAPAPAPAPDQPPASGPVGRPGSPTGSPTSDLTQSTAVAGIDNPNFTYGYYLDRMVALIRARWTRPPAGGDVETMVHFRVLTDGRVVDLEVVRSSGNAAYDLAALRAVQTASPLPPLPRSYRDDSLGVNLIFR